jgi:hypothetical protein
LAENWAFNFCWGRSILINAIFILLNFLCSLKDRKPAFTEVSAGAKRKGAI